VGSGQWAMGSEQWAVIDGRKKLQPRPNMKREILFDLKSPYRHNFQIIGYRFGAGAPRAAIVGSLRGDEIQQQYICSQVVKNLAELERAGRLEPRGEILVIPTANHFSMNVSKRFWAMDNTDINRMFPGYDKGETTQRIAAALFDIVKNYPLGIQLSSFYLQGDLIPHIRVIDTGYQDLAQAREFGLPYVLLRAPTAFDTTLLNYSWQIFGTNAYSLYSGDTENINERTARQAWQAILRFLHRNELIRYETHDGYVSRVIKEEDFHHLTSRRGGMLRRRRFSGDYVNERELLAEIIDPYDGSTLDEIYAPARGEIFFSHQRPLVSQNTLVYRLVQYS
jgi:predicted deacylase